MKKFGKILSSVLAASMLVSAFAMNAFAASKAHTVTVSADKTEGLVAGDTVTIELKMDNTQDLVSCKYVLAYDSTAFTADTTKANRLEKCIDKTWLDGMKDTDGDWGYYLGNPTYNVGIPGEMAFSWAGAIGVEAEYAMDNRVIGKFYLTVADGAADGTYTFSLTGSTMDSGENSTAAMVAAPITVTVGEPGPSTKTVDLGTISFTNGVKAEYSTGISVIIKDTVADLQGALEIALGSLELDGVTDMTVGLEVTEVPAASELVVDSYDWY